MKTFRFVLCISLVAFVAVMAHADTYNFTVTTHYDFSVPTTTYGNFGPGPGPDTGFFIVTNNSANAVTGSWVLANDGGVCGGGISVGGTLGSGLSFSESISSEASNCGGFGPNGALFTFT